MTEIAMRELRNNTSDVLRRVESGEQLDVTVNGRAVARMVPLPRRRSSMAFAELSGHRADPGLLEDLADLGGGETTDDLRDPWS